MLTEILPFNDQAQRMRNWEQILKSTINQ